MDTQNQELLATVGIMCVPYVLGVLTTLVGFWAAHKMALRHKASPPPRP